MCASSSRCSAHTARRWICIAFFTKHTMTGWLPEALKHISTICHDFKGHRSLACGWVVSQLGRVPVKWIVGRLCCLGVIVGKGMQV